MIGLNFIITLFMDERINLLIEFLEEEKIAWNEDSFNSPSFSPLIKAGDRDVSSGGL